MNHDMTPGDYDRWMELAIEQGQIYLWYWPMNLSIGELWPGIQAAADRVDLRIDLDTSDPRFLRVHNLRPTHYRGVRVND